MQKQSKFRPQMRRSRMRGARLPHDPLKGPGPFNNNPIFTRTLRFESTSAESKDAIPINTQCIRALLFASVSGTAGTGCINSFRLKRIKLWAVTSSLGQQYNQASFAWQDKFGPNKVVTVSGNTVNPGYLSVKPDPRSLLSMWNSAAATETLFSIGGPSGTICDVEFDFQLVDTDSLESGLALTTTGGTAGQLYWNQYLDNTAVSGTGNGTQIWVIQQVNSTQYGHA